MKDKRLANIVDTLFKFTRLDFSQKLEISKRGDEIDVIAYGLNTMAEELQASNKELERSRDYSENIIRAIKDPFMIMNEDSTIREVNEALLTLTKYNKEDLIGLPVNKLFSKDNFSDARSEINSLINTGKTNPDEKILVTKNGKEIPVLCSGSIIRNKKGEVEGIICIAKDITELKKLENEKRMHLEAQALAKIEKKRADILEKAELAGRYMLKKLGQQKDEIDASLQEKEVLLREIHHRVKNNMQVIISLLKLQSDHIQDQAILDVLSICRNRIKSMAVVHEQLYESVSLKYIDFEKLIRSIAANLVNSFDTSITDVVLDLENENIVMEIDTAICCALIINELVTNSLKYAFTPSSRGKKAKVYIGCKVSKNNIKLTVSDNGKGLPPGIDLKNPGSVGLQLVSDLTYQLRGKLEYDGANGTTFHISFNKKKK